MRLPALPLSCCSLVAVLAGCFNHGIPTDTRVEASPTSSVVARGLPTSLPRELRVVAFNVHMQPGEKLVEAIRTDPALRNADVIVFEEIHRANGGCSAACFVGRELGYASVYAPGHAAGDGDDGVAILARTPISDPRVIELPPFDVHVNGGRRVALAATVQLDGEPVTVYAVHLENRLTVHDRRLQMTPVLADAAKQTTPVILGGDLNTSPFTYITHLIPLPIGTQDSHMEALARSFGLETPVTRSGPTSRFLGMKLDAIYTRGFKAQRFATAEASDVSDHLALWAVLVKR